METFLKFLIRYDGDIQIYLRFRNYTIKLPKTFCILTPSIQDSVIMQKLKCMYTVHSATAFEKIVKL